jgi:hypothetical protein
MAAAAMGLAISSSEAASFGGIFRFQNVADPQFSGYVSELSQCQLLDPRWTKSDRKGPSLSFPKQTQQFEMGGDIAPPAEARARPAFLVIPGLFRICSKRELFTPDWHDPPHAGMD